MKLPNGTCSKSNFSSTTTFPIEFKIHTPDSFHRHRTRKPARNGGGIRLRKYCGTPRLRVTRILTPSSKWKLDYEGYLSVSSKDVPTTGRKIVRARRSGELLEDDAARKIAFGIKHLRFAAEYGGGGGGAKPRPVDRSYIKPTVEKATKEVIGCTRTSHKTNCLYAHMKLHEDEHLSALLKSDILRARTHINKLEAERQSSKFNLERFLEKLEEEKCSWHRKEHKKIRDLKEKLNTDTKTQKRMQNLNSKLVNELVNVKLYAEKIAHVYTKERKSRKSIEGIFSELAKRIEDGKVEVETLKRDSMKIREEVEHEHKMLHMSEVWQEARVQMKMDEAKLTLEEKYNQINKVVKNVETFLKSRITILDDMGEAEAILNADNTPVRISEMKPFSYMTSTSIGDTIEENRNGESHHKEPNSCITYTQDNQNHQNIAISKICLSSSSKKSKQEEFNGLMPNYSNVSISDEYKCSHNRPVVHCNTPDSGNPHIARAMKGRVQWPRGIQTNKLKKSKPLEATVKSQRSQLRNTLKQRN